MLQSLEIEKVTQDFGKLGYAKKRNTKTTGKNVQQKVNRRETIYTKPQMKV